MKDSLATALVLTYDAFLIGGTAYLVEVHGWSMWTFLLAALFFVTIKTKN